MNEHEVKQEERRERLLARAEKKRWEAGALEERNRRLMDCMNGTPVLVGHHSERRHRRDLEKIRRDFGRSVEASKEADDLERRAAAVGTGGISSDDEDAVEKLEDEIDKIEKTRATMKSINAAWRRAGKPSPEDAEAWRAVAEDPEVTMSEKGLAEVRKRMAVRGGYGQGDQPFEGYGLTSLGAKIRQKKKRIEDLLRRRAEPYRTEEVAPGIHVEDDPEDNRLRITFPGKPSDETRTRLAREGFRWAPSVGAWQRYRGPDAWASALRALEITESAR